MALATEFGHIHTREELIASSIRIKKLFQQLVDTLIAAQEFRKKHLDMEFPEISPAQLDTNLLLRSQMNRIYQIEGARELVEKYQEEALNRLGAHNK